jgi:hypothetical protein
MKQMLAKSEFPCVTLPAARLEHPQTTQQGLGRMAEWMRACSMGNTQTDKHMPAVEPGVPELVYSWLGDTLPDWARVSLRIAGRTSGLSTVLICSRKVGVVDGVTRQVWLEDFYKPPEVKWATKKGIRFGFRNGFWRKTFERFIVLEQYATSQGVSSLFHAEVDNLLFNVKDLTHRLNDAGKGFFCPRDATNRGVASFVYVNDTTTLRQMVETFFDDSIPMTSDMELLGHLLQHNEHFYSLPTERIMGDPPVPEWSALSIEQTKGLFDAAAIGQFMFGIDPTNCGMFLRNGFLNEHHGCDFWKLFFVLDVETGKCTLSRKPNGEGEVPLYNIHVHSKLFKAIAEPRRLSRIIDRLNNGQTTLLSVRLVQWRPIRAALSRLNGAYRKLASRLRRHFSPEVSQKKLQAFIKTTKSGRAKPTLEITNPSLAIVIPCYGHAPFLHEMFDSITNQTVQPQQVIFVVDHSPDNSLRILQDLVAQYRSTLSSQLTLLNNEVNLGQAASLNKGIDYAHTDLIMILNDDDYLMHDSVEVTIKLLKRYPQAALLGGHALHFGGNELASHPKLIESMCPADNIEIDLRLPSQVAGYRHYNDINMTHSGSSFYKSACDTIGGYQPNKALRVVPYSDRDFQLRMNALFPIALSNITPLSCWRHDSSVDRGVNS